MCYNSLLIIFIINTCLKNVVLHEVFSLATAILYMKTRKRKKGIKDY